MNQNLEVGNLELIKWKDKHDILLEEISNLWKDIKDAIESKNLRLLEEKLKDSVEFIKE
jgi:hypothetical protein